MSIWGSLTGQDAADASNAAARDTYLKQQNAITGIQNAGQNFNTGVQGLAGGYDTAAGNYQPYMRTGGQANDALSQLLQDPNSVRNLPGYQFAQGEGIQALDRSAAARGMLGSGRQSKDLLRFGTGLADQTYGNQFDRLLRGGQYGMAATGANAGLIGQGINTRLGGLQGLLGAEGQAFQGGLNSAGTIGQGQVAGAQAQQQGLQGLLGAGAYLGGSFLGGGGPKKVAGLFGGGAA